MKYKKLQILIILIPAMFLVQHVHGQSLKELYIQSEEERLSRLEVQRSVLQRLYAYAIEQQHYYYETESFQQKLQYLEIEIENIKGRIKTLKSGPKDSRIFGDN